MKFFPEKDLKHSWSKDIIITSFLINVRKSQKMRKKIIRQKCKKKKRQLLNEEEDKS